MDIKDVVMQAVRKYNEKKQYWPVVNENTVLRSDKSPLDSLAFVGLMAAVDWELKQVTGRDVEIFKPEYFLGKADNPYKTVGSLMGLAMQLCGDVNYHTGGILGIKKPKIIFTDLDGTLWDGIGGEGEVRIVSRLVDKLVDLNDAGILLALVTKNYNDIVEKELFSIFKSFLSTRFVTCKYNVVDKAATIRDVCADLNLGLDSAVFLDDDEHERDRVKTALPMVWVPENHMDIAKIETGVVTEEDRNRTAMYKQEYKRARSKPHSDSMDDYMAWLASLDMVLTVKMAETEEEKARANELIDRSNQFNFGKDKPQGVYKTHVFSLSDRFGSMGIVAAININFCGLVWNFCVSCRVLGRGVENVIAQWIRKNGCGLNQPIYSGKNKAAMDFWRVAQHNNTKYPIKVIEE